MVYNFVKVQLLQNFVTNRFTMKVQIREAKTQEEIYNYQIDYVELMDFANHGKVANLWIGADEFHKFIEELTTEEGGDVAVVYPLPLGGVDTKLPSPLKLMRRDFGPVTEKQGAPHLLVSKVEIVKKILGEVYKKFMEDEKNRRLIEVRLS